MKCTEYEQMSRHVEGETAGREKMAMDTHLLNCPACRNLYEECQAEREALRAALRAPALPGSFTEDIMAQLKPYAVVPEEPQAPEPVRKAGKRKWKRWAYAAAGTLLAVSVAASVSPSFASYLTQSIFNRNNQMIDLGLQMAGEKGFVQQGNYYVTDNGITLRVLDVVADPTRIALSYVLEKEGGGHLDPDFDPRFREEAGNRVYLTDTKGNKLADMSSWGRNDPYGIIGFQLENNIPEKAVVHFELSRVGGFAGIGAKEGRWELQVPVDMKKGLEATRSTAVNLQHTTGQGVSINIKTLLFAPTKSQLEFETSITGSAKKKLQELVERESRLGIAEEGADAYRDYTYGISYRLLDEKGRVVAGKSGPVLPSGERERNPIDSSGVHKPFGRTVWKDGFVPLGEAKRLTFVLDAVDMEEPSDFSLSFTPDNLKKSPVTGQYQGSTIKIKSFVVKRDWDIKKRPPFFEDESHAIIELEGVHPQNTGTFTHWVVTDENGRTYKAMVSGGEEDPDASGNRKFTSTLRVYGLKHEPKKLTLSLTRIMKRHTDVDWKVDIPVSR
jgi:hypothetical protein